MEDITMKIPVSKYNEVNIKDVEKLIKSKSQIRYSEYRHNNEHVGCITINGIVYNLKAGDEVCINNVWLPLAYAKDEYFSQYIEIL